MIIKPYFKYNTSGIQHEAFAFDCQHFKCDFDMTDNHISLKITSQEKIQFVSCFLSFEHGFDDELFFSNGYQSWTTCYEFSKNDVQKGYTPIADISNYTKNLAASSGDYLFTEYKNEKGFFHSHTYTYLKKGELYTLYGSLSERNGFTIFYADMKNNLFKIVKDVEGLIFDGEYQMFDLVYFTGTYDEVFSKYFSAMNLKNSKIDYLSGYTSWYNYFQKIDENIILRDLKGLTRVKECANIFQIDDGYEIAVGDWLPKNEEKFPNGMKAIADEIHSNSFLAGIWLAPFNAQKSSNILKEHPDWVIKDKNNKPLLTCFAWGGAYAFDVYNEQFREHLKHVFDVVLNDWGYDMVKLDFLYSQCVLPRYGKTRGQIMCEAMDFLRECVGEKLLLGCGVPLGPSFGVVDACRISCDVDLNYSGKYYNKLKLNNEIPSTQNAINNTILRRHLNKNAFLNDPDVFFLRDNNLKFTFEQKMLLGKINNLFGNVLFVSDDAGEYGEGTLENMKMFLRRTNNKIISAEYTSKDVIEIQYFDRKERHLKFNIKTGELKK